MRVRARAILISGLTTIAALGSLAVSGNPGIRTIASTTASTLGMTLIALLFWFPLWLLSTKERNGSG